MSDQKESVPIDLAVNVPDQAIFPSGRYVFRDDFDSLNFWRTVAGNPSVSGSILALPAGAEIRTKQKFLYGMLVILAKSDSAPSLQIGFDDGGDNYVVWSNGNLRYKSTADNAEGTYGVAATETAYTMFTLLWEPDNVTIWTPNAVYGTYQGAKVPNKPSQVSIKNIGSGTVNADFIVVYPELVGTWLGGNVGGSSVMAAHGMPIYILSGSQLMGWAGISEKLLAAPYTDTTTPLGASATFTGTSRDLGFSASPYTGYGGIRAMALADQAGTLYIDESPDNSFWISGVASVAVSANTPTRLDHKAIYRYVRVRYVNGGTAQGSFRLWSRVCGVLT